MLITYEELLSILERYNISIRNILHIGAHECEEKDLYSKLGIDDDGIVWIEALEHKVKQAKERGVKNIYCLVASDKDNQQVTFNISNNGESSSIFKFGTHSVEHPTIHFISSLQLRTLTIDTFVEQENIEISKFNMWNLDIQGAELLAIKGGENSLKFVDLLYAEVNEKELYKGCALIGELDTYLKERGLIRIMTKMTKHGWGDAVYVRLDNKNDSLS